MEPATDPETLTEAQQVVLRRFHEARQAGLTHVEARLFAESDTEIRLLRSLVAKGCGPALMAKNPDLREGVGRTAHCHQMGTVATLEAILARAAAPEPQHREHLTEPDALREKRRLHALELALLRAEVAELRKLVDAANGRRPSGVRPRLREAPRSDPPR